MKKILSKIKIPTPKIPLPGLGAVMELGETLFDGVTGTLDTGVGLLKSTLGGISFFGSTASSKDYDHTKFDEKHYFLIPDKTSDEGFAFHIIRCLPEGVPPINELPKRRFLHLSNKHALPMLESIVVREVTQAVKDEPRSENFVFKNLDALIDDIDEVEQKAFNGVLLVGGLIALINPLAGATVAMKAMVPALGLTLSKHGLKLANQTASNIDVANKIRRAEKDVKEQFKEASTAMLINPLLAHLENTGDLNTWMMEPEKFKFQSGKTELSQADIIRLMGLTRQAITDVSDGEVSDQYFDKISEMVLWGSSDT